MSTPATRDPAFRSRNWRWLPVYAAAFGALAAASATSGYDAVVVLITAAAGGALGYLARVVGAVERRVWRPPMKSFPKFNWRSLVGVPGAYVALAMVSGWTLSEWPGLFITIAQIINGDNFAVAIVGLWIYMRRRRSILPSQQ